MPTAGWPCQQQEDGSFAPENFWSHNVHCSSRTLSHWSLRGLILASLGSRKEAGRPPCQCWGRQEGLKFTPLLSALALALAQCAGRGRFFPAGDVDTSCTAGCSTFCPEFIHLQLGAHGDGQGLVHCLSAMISAFPCPSVPVLCTGPQLLFRTIDQLASSLSLHSRSPLRRSLLPCVRTPTPGLVAPMQGTPAGCSSRSQTWD